MTIVPFPPAHSPAATIRPVVSDNDLRAAFAVRSAVFRDEQRLADLPMTDPDEDRSWTLVAELDGIVVATGRLTPPSPQRMAYLSWIATLRDYRHVGIGSALVQALVEEADRRSYPMTLLSAQTHAIRFYGRFGYRSFGTVFTVRGIPHQSMSRTRPFSPNETSR